MPDSNPHPNADLMTQLSALRIVSSRGGGKRSIQIGLLQKERDQADVDRAYALQERIALGSEVDAAARRVTDLYTKAVEQTRLGQGSGPVGWARRRPWLSIIAEMKEALRPGQTLNRRTSTKKWS